MWGRRELTKDERERHHEAVRSILDRFRAGNTKQTNEELHALLEKHPDDLELRATVRNHPNYRTEAKHK